MSSDSDAGPGSHTRAAGDAGLFLGRAQRGFSAQGAPLVRPVYSEVCQPKDDTSVGSPSALPSIALEAQSTSSNAGSGGGERSSVSTGLAAVTADVLKEQQTLESVIYIVRGWMEHPETVPDDDNIHTLNPEVQHLWAQRQTLEVENGVLYRRYVRPDGSLRYLQVVVPRSLRTQFLDAVHVGPINGHMGVEKTQLKLQEIAYWQGWRFDTQMYVRRCHVCGSYRHGPRQKQGQLQRALANDVMQKVHIDLVGPFCLSKRGYRYLLTVICCFTKYLICVPIRDKLSISVADALMRHVYLIYNPPEILVHDQGGEFWSEVMRQLATLLGIQPSKITSHRPSSNGVVERVHATLHSMFAKVIDRHQRNWCELTPYVTYAYNTASHSSSTFSPFYLMFLRHPRMPIELQLNKPSAAAVETEDQYVTLASERMRSAYDIVRSHLHAAFEKAKARYDSRVKAAKFEEGQFVWHYVPRSRKGLVRKWECNNRGPFRIVKRLNDVNYIIQKSPRGQRLIVHIDRLSPYCGNVPSAWQSAGVNVPDEQPPAEILGTSTVAATAGGESSRNARRPIRSRRHHEAPPTDAAPPTEDVTPRRAVRPPRWLTDYIGPCSQNGEVDVHSLWQSA